MSSLPEVRSGPACLSDFSVSALVSHSVAEHEQHRLHEHLSNCRACAQRVAEERGEFRAAQLERIPEALSSPKKSTARAPWFGGLFLAGAAAVGAVLLLPQTDAPELRRKGSSAVHVSVKRGDALLVHDVPAASLQSLRPGDRLRLRLVGAHRFARVENREAKGTAVVFEDAVPKDGWLPFALALTPDGETEITITSCAEAFGSTAKNDACDVHTLHF